MARLLDCFSPLLTFGADLAAAVEGGTPPARPEGVQERALSLLQSARDAAGRSAVPSEWIESASFALVAWIDEIVARHPAWQSATPLQARLFNSTNAPSEFFHHLAALQPEEGELREIYWLALVFGFKGQYHFEHGDQGELGKLKALHAQQLPLRPLAPADATSPRRRITPQPYATPTPSGPRIPERRERALLRSAAAAALLVPLLYWLWFMLDAPQGLPSTLTRDGLPCPAWICATASSPSAGAWQAAQRWPVARSSPPIEVAATPPDPRRTAAQRLAPTNAMDAT